MLVADCERCDDTGVAGEAYCDCLAGRVREETAKDVDNLLLHAAVEGASRERAYYKGLLRDLYRNAWTMVGMAVAGAALIAYDVGATWNVPSLALGGIMVGALLLANVVVGLVTERPDRKARLPGAKRTGLAAVWEGCGGWIVVLLIFLVWMLVAILVGIVFK